LNPASRGAASSIQFRGECWVGEPAARQRLSRLTAAGPMSSICWLSSVSTVKFNNPAIIDHPCLASGCPWTEETRNPDRSGLTWGLVEPERAHQALSTWAPFGRPRHAATSSSPVSQKLSEPRIGWNVDFAVQQDLVKSGPIIPTGEVWLRDFLISRILRVIGRIARGPSSAGRRMVTWINGAGGVTCWL